MSADKIEGMISEIMECEINFNPGSVAMVVAKICDVLTELNNANRL